MTIPADESTPAGVIRRVVEAIGRGSDVDVELCRVSPALLAEALGMGATTAAPTTAGRLVGVGEPLSSGIGAGRPIGPVDAASCTDPYVVVADTTGPADTSALLGADGIVTSTLGHASHAAIVARSGRVPAVGLRDAEALLGALPATAWVVVNGDTGEVRVVDEADLRPARRNVPTLADPPPLSGAVVELLAIADDVRSGSPAVLANVDTADQVDLAATCGAEGIGLCRTERWLEPADVSDLLAPLLAAIGAESAASSVVPKGALDRFTERQTHAAGALFEAAGRVEGWSGATVRLLDVAPNELPALSGPGGAVRTGSGPGAVRGARFLALYPQLVEAQVTAIVRAWKQHAPALSLRLLIPYVVDAGEVGEIRGAAIAALGSAGEAAPDWGVMLETPAALLNSPSITAGAGGATIGTNDLTQLVMGLDRRAAPSAVAGRYGADPFVELDQRGVMRLAMLGIDSARHASPDIEITWCGDQLRDPASLAAVLVSQPSAVSVPPGAVPMARLVAGQFAAVADRQSRST